MARSCQDARHGRVVEVSHGDREVYDEHMLVVQTPPVPRRGGDMESSAKAAGHPIHQQLIVFPLGLLATAVVFDVLRLLTGNDDFSVASWFMIAAGVLSGLVAAVFGAID